jgi:hypothetical protein
MRPRQLSYEWCDFCSLLWPLRQPHSWSLPAYPEVLVSENAVFSEALRHLVSRRPCDLVDDIDIDGFPIVRNPRLHSLLVIRRWLRLACAKQ